MTRLPITAASLVCATGRGLDQYAEALVAERSGLGPNSLDWLDFDGVIGRVAGLEDEPVRADLGDFDCRNNRLAQMALETDGFAEAVERAVAAYGRERIGVILGTSTSGIAETERAYAARDPDTGTLPAWYRLEETHAYYSLARFVAACLGVAGPCHVVSTACSSSSKAVVDACDWIEMGLCDAVVAGGVDSLCRLTLKGFGSLDLIDPTPARPCDLTRAGINIGEAAGFVLLERDGTRANTVCANVIGAGESSDGYHMSAPDPDGTGASIAMTAALDAAGLAGGEIDHVVLHGTGTQLNDRVENVALYRVFGADISASSCKAWTGHTLGAAGILGVLTALVAIRDGFRPANLNLATPDPAMKVPLLQTGKRGAGRGVLTNAFGFGGSNCSIVLGAAE